MPIVLHSHELQTSSGESPLIIFRIFRYYSYNTANMMRECHKILLNLVLHKSEKWSHSHSISVKKKELMANKSSCREKQSLLKRSEGTKSPLSEQYFKP